MRYDRPGWWSPPREEGPVTANMWGRMVKDFWAAMEVENMAWSARNMSWNDERAVSK